MTATGTRRKLDPTRTSKLSNLLIQQLAASVAGQETATQALVDMVEAYRAGIGDKTRPAGNALFLGPTGCGKTHTIEALASALFGTSRACIKVDCAEFAHSHEIAKLIGSPPGYLGHRETSPMLTQEALDRFHTDGLKLSILLFDEIEKASDTLWSLLLGIMDKASLTLGDNRVVNFSKVIIVLTSNVGAREMSNRGIGFLDPTEERDDIRREKIAISAAKSKFLPELMNRIERVVVFKTLTQLEIQQVLEIELKELEFRLFAASSPLTLESDDKFSRIVMPRFKLAVSPSAKKTLLSEGYSIEYGARALKRVIDTRIQKPIAKLLISGQITAGDTLIIDDQGGEIFDFVVQPAPPKEITNEIQS
jgi:ATP-dependent Clp protease ATP-binding subunit ClpA